MCGVSFAEIGFVTEKKDLSVRGLDGILVIESHIDSLIGAWTGFEPYGDS